MRRCFINKIILVSFLLFGFYLLMDTSQVQAVEYPAPAKAILKKWKVEIQKTKPGFQGFKAKKGQTLYYQKRIHSKKNEERSCSTCHLNDPKKSGETPMGKAIDPLAPSVNMKRFTDPEKIEKWFKRNCKWVLERQCTAEEKGHFLTFLFSVP